MRWPGSLQRMVSKQRIEMLILVATYRVPFLSVDEYLESKHGVR